MDYDLLASIYTSSRLKHHQEDSSDEYGEGEDHIWNWSNTDPSLIDLVLNFFV
jgi:hypothetical protein